MNEIVQVPTINTIPYTGNETIHNPISVFDKQGRLAVRSRIDNYEEALKKLMGSETGDADEINSNGLKEYFLNDVYVRELFIPEDTTIVSQIWNRERSWIISKGEVTIVTEMGTKRVRAPHTEVVPPGSKVALYTHEDTQWLAMTKVNSKNIKDVEGEIISKDYSDCIYPWDILGEYK